jgi:starch synthase
MKILMVAAENDAMPGGKVGGIGDVVRDVPLALGKAGQKVDVVMPGYGAFSQLSGAKHIRALSVMFRGEPQNVDVYQINVNDQAQAVVQWVLEHPLFAAGGIGKIYCDDPDNRPFATDASKFALFSAAVAKAICEGVFGKLDVLHLHDWHSALVSVLATFAPEYRAVKSIHTVYTIHNLALQGIRPLGGDESSLASWFPELNYQSELINDPVHRHCINPMRAGINLADKVHTVSPTYAREVLLASKPQQGFYGGEGLEQDLTRASAEGRLHGILNGCEYPEQTQTKLSRDALYLLIENEVIKWLGNQAVVASAHLIALKRLTQLSAATKASSDLLVTSIGRITDQKLRLLQQKMSDGKTALEHLLDMLGTQGVFILVGSGDGKLEAFLTKIAADKSNFLFLNGYSQALPDSIYQSGDLFLMPSSFEPCGISQMLAMRDGQPCLAHKVGGLSDTITHLHNGFTFSGDDPAQQAQNMLSCFQSALTLKQQAGDQWQKIASNAAKSRFLWSHAAQHYVDLLYNKDLTVG